MSHETPASVTLVHLVHPGVGYQPITLPTYGLPPITPGRPFECHPRIAARLLKGFPGTIAVVSFKLPTEPDAPASAEPVKE